MLHISNEQGQGIIEYALILVLVSILGVGFLGAFGAQLFSVFTFIQETLSLVGA